MNLSGHIPRSITLVGLLLGAMIPAKATPVMFQVNMGPQIQRGNFHPDTDTVLVAGDAINNWSTSASPLTNSVSNTNIWLETFDVPGDTGATVQYKFIFNSAQSGIVWEGNVGTGGAQNRSFTLTAAAQMLPVAYFNNVSTAGVVKTPVTFQVDMSAQIALGSFDPASDTVSVAGDALNNWNATASTLTNSPAASSIWLGTFTISEAPGTTVAYKFVINGSNWESRDNRTFTLSSAAQTLAPVYFNDVAGMPTDIPLVFQVDMSAQTAQGAFNPATDTVFAAGSFNSWSTTSLQLTNSSGQTNLFTGSAVDSNDAAGAMIQFKFLINGSNWESIANRAYTLTSTNQQNIPVAYFNDVSNLGLLSLDPSTGGQASLSWTAGPSVRLQSAINLKQPVWQDVPNTLGQSNIVVSLGAPQSYFRLIGP